MTDDARQGIGAGWDRAREKHSCSQREKSPEKEKRQETERKVARDRTDYFKTQGKASRETEEIQRP